MIHWGRALDWLVHTISLSIFLTLIIAMRRLSVTGVAGVSNVEIAGLISHHLFPRAIVWTLGAGAIATSIAFSFLTLVNPGARGKILYLTMSIIALVEILIRLARRKVMRHASRHFYKICPKCLYPIVADGGCVRCSECGLKMTISEIEKAWRTALGQQLREIR